MLDTVSVYHTGEKIAMRNILSGLIQLCEVNKGVRSGTTILQTNRWHHEEKPQNINRNKTQERQSKQSNQLSLPHPGDCKTRKDTKLCIPKDISQAWSVCIVNSVAS